MSENEEDDEFDRLVSKIASNEPFQNGRVKYRGRIGLKNAARLAHALRYNHTVSKLFLIESSLGNEGVALLAEGLHSNSSITGIVLADNSIDDAGVGALGGLLQVNSSITHIVLFGNNIGDKGARALAKVLPINSSITVLNLGRNSIGPEGASALAKGLLDNSTVSTLGLAGNDIGDDGARALVDSLLRGNSTLTYLVLYDDNDISIELVIMVQDLVRINQGARNPREALERKIEWLENLDDTGVELLGLEHGRKEEQRMIRVETEIGWLVNSEEEGAEDKAAVSLTLRELRSGNLPWADQRRRLVGRLLGSPRHGVRVAKSLGKVGGRALYRRVAECGAAPDVLMKLLRAHSFLCAECRDTMTGLFPFMLLATMQEANVGHVMEALLLDPSLVERGICRPAQ